MGGASDSGFRKVTIDAQPGEPIALAVLPDGSVLHTTRPGSVYWHGVDGTKVEAGTLAVYTHDEEGLQGIAVDPDFDINHWVYLYYSPALDTVSDDQSTTADEGAAPLTGNADSWTPFRGQMRLSRFRFDAPLLDLASERIVLEVPVDRGMCCHVGGKLDFDGAGNLYLSTGDDTNPFQSSGYTPIDERLDHHPALDAQRSAGNTNDLRGKLLRIHVEADGSYTIPDGNLFPPGTAATRPEIYAMGLRNPYRFSVNRSTGEIYLADYSPDATLADPARGPAGTGKWMVIREPSNWGWPYCATPSLPYVHYDFATETSQETFDCAHPSNHSPRNTGLVDLPAVSEPDLAYSYSALPSVPALGSGGVGPMGGPAYDYAAGNPSSTPSPGKWPEQYAGLPLFYEWTRDFVGTVQLDAAGKWSALTRLPFAVDNPIDLAFSPDGTLYVLEYGDTYFVANPEAQLARIEFVQNSRLSQ
jgi:cytochrome c